MNTDFYYGADGYWHAPEIDPSDVADYTLDFAGLLQGDTISTVVWAIAAGVVTIDLAHNTNTATTATVWLKNAGLGKDITIAALITTVGGRTFERSFRVDCIQL